MAGALESFVLNRPSAKQSFDVSMWHHAVTDVQYR
jgi:hypothetical protein